MRFMMKVELPTELANEMAVDGELESTIGSILDDMKPEAAYFVASNGERCGFIFFEMADSSQIPAMAEPWFHAFEANVDIVPAMNLDDLKKAGPGIKKAVKKYG